jgi:hypothetical protein
MQAIPKIIWFLWLQGLEAAPAVVRKCHDSWIRHNPDWQFIFLDEGNIRKHADINIKSVTSQAFSDILRINLLAKHGGVWADATCFCNKPLDEWLTGYMKTGFFAFNKPAPDRMISSWFIASVKNNYITTVWQGAVNNYWQNHPHLVSFENSRWHFLRKRIQKRPTAIWFTYLFTSALKVYPYFWFHYLFAYCYNRDGRFRQLWNDTSKFSADVPHKLQLTGLLNQLTDDVKDEIDKKISPVYKLTWKFNDADFVSGCTLDYLLNPSSKRTK